MVQQGHGKKSRTGSTGRGNDGRVDTNNVRHCEEGGEASADLGEEVAVLALLGLSKQSGQANA